MKYILNPYEYEDYLILVGHTEDRAKEIVDKSYIEQYGVSREEHRKQSEELWKGYKWNKLKD